ncbi:hypothetical protein QL285_035264 [Trifolium repens]|nr:hypothetical protein QL285_035264 [Trifolium repens]
MLCLSWSCPALSNIYEISHGWCGLVFILFAHLFHLTTVLAGPPLCRVVNHLHRITGPTCYSGKNLAEKEDRERGGRISCV